MSTFYRKSDIDTIFANPGMYKTRDQIISAIANITTHDFDSHGNGENADWTGWLSNGQTMSRMTKSGVVGIVTIDGRSSSGVFRSPDPHVQDHLMDSGYMEGEMQSMMDSKAIESFGGWIDVIPETYDEYWSRWACGKGDMSPRTRTTKTNTIITYFPGDNKIRITLEDNSIRYHDMPLDQQTLVRRLEMIGEAWGGWQD